MPRLWMAVAAALLSGLGCGKTSDSESFLTLGVIIPYTGPKAQRGISVERSLLMSVDQINRSGGVAGHQVKLRVADTRSTTYEGLDAAQDLLGSDEIAAVIGPEDSALGELLAPDAKVRDRLLIEPSPTLTSIAIGVGQRTHWVRLNPSISALARRIADEIIADNRKKILVAYVIDSFGTAFNDILVRYVVGGQRSVFSTAVQLSDASSSASVVSALDAARSAPYDAIVVATYPGQAANLVNETVFQHGPARDGQIGWYFPQIARGEDFTNHVLQSYVEGARGASSGQSADAPAFSDEFEQKWFGGTPTEDAYYYVDALNLLALGIEGVGLEAGSRLSGSRLLDRIRALTSLSGRNVHWDQIGEGLEALRRGEAVTYQGLTGDLSLLEGDPQRSNVTVATWRIQSGRYVKD